MIIGIDGSRAFLSERTGVEEYSYQIIKHLAEIKELSNSKAKVILYLRKGQKIDLNLPKNWKTKTLNWPRFWTQLGLSLEMLFHPVDVLFISAHVTPLIHPSRTVVVIHGLEYEIIKEAYSFWERFYMRHSIKFSCRWAKKIIAVSKNTKKDLMELYNVPENKIEVVYAGISSHSERSEESRDLIPRSFANAQDDGYLLFIGRLEKRKNIIGIISAFEVLKKRYNIPFKLALIGRTGFGYQEIKNKIEDSKYKTEIIETGFLNEKEKCALMKGSKVFLFPTLYEGFGLPILEAQALGVPVVTSNVSSLPEVGGDSVAYCNPQEPESIAAAIYKVINDENFKDALIGKGYENIKKFSWKKCAEEISRLLVE